MIGVPCMLSGHELEEDLRQARELLEEEATRSRGAGAFGASVEARPRASGPMLADDDIQVLRRKHPFLSEFSDNFIRFTPIGDLMKIQSTAMKAGEIEKAKDADDRLAFNKSALASTLITVRFYFIKIR
jgi:hypothetical protein